MGEVHSCSFPSRRWVCWEEETAHFFLHIDHLVCSKQLVNKCLIETENFKKNCSLAQVIIIFKVKINRKTNKWKSQYSCDYVYMDICNSIIHIFSSIHVYHLYLPRHRNEQRNSYFLVRFLNFSGHQFHFLWTSGIGAAVWNLINFESNL